MCDQSRRDLSRLVSKDRARLTAPAASRNPTHDAGVGSAGGQASAVNISTAGPERVDGTLTPARAAAARKAEAAL